MGRSTLSLLTYPLGEPGPRHFMLPALAPLSGSAHTRFPLERILRAHSATDLCTCTHDHFLFVPPLAERRACSSSLPHLNTHTARSRPYSSRWATTFRFSSSAKPDRRFSRVQFGLQRAREKLELLPRTRCRDLQPRASVRYPSGRYLLGPRARAPPRLIVPPPAPEVAHLAAHVTHLVP